MNLRFNPQFCDPQGALIRRFPLGGTEDTCLQNLDGSNKTYFKAHSHRLFRDREILEVELHPDQYRPPLFGKTPDGRTLIQQRGWLGCGPACASMLLADHGIEPDQQWLDEADLTDVEFLSEILEKSGLKITASQSSEPDIGIRARVLETQLLFGGSMIVGISGEIGAHFVILDALSTANGTAKLRDPFHGWAIVTTAQSFLGRTRELQFIQSSGKNRWLKAADLASRFLAFFRLSCR